VHTRKLSLGVEYLRWMLQKQMTLLQRELRCSYICAELESFRIYLDWRSEKYVQSEQDRAVKPDN
jgi:hypothetical protein